MRASRREGGGGAEAVEDEVGHGEAVEGDAVEGDAVEAEDGYCRFCNGGSKLFLSWPAELEATVQVFLGWIHYL